MRTAASCRTCCVSLWEGGDLVRHPAIVVAALLLSVGGAGCRFWYKPVPVANAIGETEMVLAGDTVNVHRDERFELYGPNSEAVFDGYEQMNRAYRAFERHFHARPPKLAVLLFQDSIVPLDAATTKTFRDRDFLPLYYARPQSVRSRRRYGGLDYGGATWPIAPTAARVMLARFADQELGGGPRPDNVVLERFPLWFRAAYLHLLGESGAFERDMQLVREKRALWMPLKDLIVMVRPAAGDSLLDPSRRNEADETMQLLAAQATTLGRFLVEREGPAVLGRLARGYLTNRPIADMLRETRSGTRTVADLERSWQVWVATREN
jgi:hypothetical protein